MSTEHQERLRAMIAEAIATKAPVVLECPDAAHARRLRNALYRVRESHPLKDRIVLRIVGAVLRLEWRPDLLDGVAVQ